MSKTIGNGASHHLLRVKMNKKRFLQLKEIATSVSKEESYVSVSDIVRVAIDNWLQIYEAQQRALENYERARKGKETAKRVTRSPFIKNEGHRPNKPKTDGDNGEQ